MRQLRLRILVVGLWVLASCAPVLAQQQMPEGWDRYLGHPRGPYRGRIVDTETKAPLAGAVVVALWKRDRVYPFQVNSEHYAVRETIADVDGRFVMEARDIEEGAPRRTHKPEFLVFLPGYGAFPHRHVSPTGFIAELFYGPGSTIELPRLGSRDDRLANLDRFAPHDFSRSPQKMVPKLLEAINEERRVLGLNAYPTSETD